MTASASMRTELQCINFVFFENNMRRKRQLQLLHVAATGDGAKQSRQKNFVTNERTTEYD